MHLYWHNKHARILNSSSFTILFSHVCFHFVLRLTTGMAAHTPLFCCFAQEGVTSYNEVYGVCPDQVVSDAKWHKAGDLRATVAPFLANMTIGPNNFKWMLFGDDDTVFLIDNVLHLLPHLDPTVPYFMTDHLWYPQPPGELPSHRLHSADVL
jgi:hypothetical protein